MHKQTIGALEQAEFSPNSEMKIGNRAVKRKARMPPDTSEFGFKRINRRRALKSPSKFGENRVENGFKPIGNGLVAVVIRMDVV